MSGGHPSFYALDLLKLGEPARAGEREHLATCGSCAAYLEQVGAPAATALPGWLAGVRLAAAPPPQARRQAMGAASSWRGPRWRFLWPALAATAAAAVGVLALRPARVIDAPADGIREKGAPAVQLYVKRGARVFTWSGGRVHPGDRLQMEVNGAGFGFVSLAGRSAPENKPVVLYDGALDSGAHLLPLSFRVDAEGKQEILSVIFGRRPIPAELHVRAEEPGTGQPDEDSGKESEKTRGKGNARRDEQAATWRQILVLDKENP